MNFGVLVIIAVTLGLVVIVVLPRVRGLGGDNRTTVERRSGRERRQRRRPVPKDRRRRSRRAEDAARAFVENLGG